MDNSPDRLHDVFFYGLYMDPDILEQQGITIRNPRKGTVTDYILRIGNRATLLRQANAKAHGLIYSLTHNEIHRLYWGAGLEQYRSEAIIVQTESGPVAALCCNLLDPPGEQESNTDYNSKLKSVMEKLDLPIEF